MESTHARQKLRLFSRNFRRPVTVDVTPVATHGGTVTGAFVWIRATGAGDALERAARTLVGCSMGRLHAPLPYGRSAVVSGDARVVKATPDGVLCWFRDPATAIGAALGLAAHPLRPDAPRACAGVSYGHAIACGADLVGDDIDVAARVAGHAAPGDVLCTTTVRARSILHARDITFELLEASDLVRVTRSR